MQKKLKDKLYHQLWFAFSEKDNIYECFAREMNVKSAMVIWTRIAGRYLLNCMFQMDVWFILCSLCLASDLWLAAAFIKGLFRHTETIANEKKLPLGLIWALVLQTMQQHLCC